MLNTFVQVFQYILKEIFHFEFLFLFSFYSWCYTNYIAYTFGSNTSKASTHAEAKMCYFLVNALSKTPMRTCALQGK